MSGAPLLRIAYLRQPGKCSEADVPAERCCEIVGAIEDTFIPDSRDPRGFRDPQVRHAIGSFQAEFIGSELGPMLGWTTGHANDRVHEATDVITRTPRLFNRVGTGEIEPAKLAAIHRALGRVSRVTEDGLSATRDLAAQVEAALLGDPEGSTTLEQGNTDLLARSSAPLIACRTSAS